MRQIFIPENDTVLQEVLAAYEFPATLLGAVRYGQGHINDTFCVLRRVTASASSFRACPAPPSPTPRS